MNEEDRTAILERRLSEYEEGHVEGEEFVNENLHLCTVKRWRPIRVPSNGASHIERWKRSMKGECNSSCETEFPALARNPHRVGIAEFFGWKDAVMEYPQFGENPERMD